jgi:P-type Ca2+ transporter type 2C
MENKDYPSLTEKEAKKRLKEYGPNEIRDVSKTTPLRILSRQVKSNFVIYLLLFAMVLSFFVGKTLTGYVILGVIIIIITTGFIQEFKAEKSVEALKNMLTSVSLVIRDGEEKEIPSNEIVPDDILILRTGEKIPADCVILDQKDLLVNESVLTGESKEVKKTPPKKLESYTDENLIFMGSYVVNGKCKAKVIHTSMNTKFGKIAGMISTAEKELPLQKKVNKIVKYMVLFGGSFALLTGLIMLLRIPGFDSDLIIEALIIVIAVAVASFPEGFPVVLITSLASGSYRMAKKNAIVNRMSIIETLGETTVICSDKTGTITKGEMTVNKIFSNNKVIDVTGAGYEDDGGFFYKRKKIDVEKEKTIHLLLKAGILCNDSKIQRKEDGDTYKISGLPTEASLLILGAKAHLFREDMNFEREDEIPFSSERKMMSVLVKEKKQEYVYVKGALEILLERCKYIQKEKGVFELTKRDKKRILDENKRFTSKALRTLALGYKKADSKDIQKFENNLIFLGFVGIEDPPREEIKEAIETCREGGINVKMITGDNKETALSIAKQIDLDEGEILLGSDLDNITDEELIKIVKDVVVFARVKPEHKLRIVKALKENDEIVTMTGDGVNDAPALKEAHIGVAMGKNGTDVSRSVADLTLKDDHFATIVDAIKEGRTIFTNIQKFSVYQISVNFSQVLLIFLAILLGMPLPLVAIQILFMNLFSDELTAITLAFNPYSGDVMSHKPRKKSNIITHPLFIMLAFSGLIMSLGSLGVFYYALNIGQSEIAARTMTFVTMVLFGITNAFNFRSFRKLTLTRTPFSNKSLVYVSIFAIFTTLVIIYTPLNKVLETTAIKPTFLIIPLLVSFMVVFVFDIMKYLNEKKHFWTEDMQHFKSRNGHGI